MKARILSAVFVAPIFFALTVGAQQPQEKSSADSSVQATAQVKPGKEYLGPIAESIRPYRPTNRDPFKRVPKVVKQSRAKSLAMRALGFPTLDARRAEFRQKVQQAVAADRSEPDPVSQYLVGEVEVTGVFRDDRGFGAFVRAQPSGTMFFVRHGSRLYNGEVVRISGDDGEGSARVQFREVSYIEVNGKQTPQEHVVTKAAGVVARH